ncbi:MAG: Hsp33 family molecular chaperone [Hyphomicrobiaceae bacterium]
MTSQSDNPDHGQSGGLTTARLPGGEDLPDDVVVPFQTVVSRINGRLVRLGAAVDEVLRNHDYPEPVSIALGQAVTLSAMLGASLKFDGKLVLQTSTDGALNLLVVNFETPGQLRGYARFDAARVQELVASPEPIAESDLIGTGHLAMTIDPRGEMDRYQGIVAIEQDGLIGAALSYFRQSEQLPTFIRLAVARHFVAGPDGQGGQWSWRAGGLQLQHLTSEGGKLIETDGRENDPDFEGEPGADVEENEDWRRVRLLAETVEDHELLDPNLTPERLIYRLFHEEGVRASPPRPIEAHCQCSKQRLQSFLLSFDDPELIEMRGESGQLEVKCEFCTKTYEFDVENLLKTKESLPKTKG